MGGWMDGFQTFSEFILFEFNSLSYLVLLFLAGFDYQKQQVEIHQSLQSQFSLLVEFLTVKLPVKILNTVVEFYSW